MSNENTDRTVAQRAQAVYDVSGEDAMLEYIRRHRRQPQAKDHDFHGYALLDDGSTVEISPKGYEFSGAETRQVRAGRANLAGAFTESAPIYPGWMTTSKLCHLFLNAVAELNTGPDDRSEPAISEAECYARWPHLEEAVRFEAAKRDADANVTEALHESISQSGKLIAAMCDPKTRAEVATAVVDELRRRDREKAGEC